MPDAIPAIDLVDSESHEEPEYDEHSDCAKGCKNDQCREAQHVVVSLTDIPAAYK